MQGPILTLDIGGGTVFGCRKRGLWKSKFVFVLVLAKVRASYRNFIPSEPTHQTFQTLFPHLDLTDAYLAQICSPTEDVRTWTHSSGSIAPMRGFCGLQTGPDL